MRQRQPSSRQCETFGMDIIGYIFFLNECITIKINFMEDTVIVMRHGPKRERGRKLLHNKTDLLKAFFLCRI